MTGDAWDTLHRGTRFLESLADHRSLAKPWPEGRSGVVRAHFIGNCLAELDRFLHVLLDEIAPHAGLPAAPAQRNAANKIGRVAGLRWDLASDQARLRALGRSRACLCRCDGLVRRADVSGGDWMTAGWTDPGAATLRRYPLGDRLAPGGTDLAGVGRFYEGLARRLATVP